MQSPIEQEYGSKNIRIPRTKEEFDASINKRKLFGTRPEDEKDDSGLTYSKERAIKQKLVRDILGKNGANPKPNSSYSVADLVRVPNPETLLAILLKVNTLLDSELKGHDQAILSIVLFQLGGTLGWEFGRLETLETCWFLQLNEWCDAVLNVPTSGYMMTAQLSEVQKNILTELLKFNRAIGDVS
ncbi:MAG: hypothetical protein V4490_04360, partial [Pseudomonadota bacterium]